jgi:hypothetical protein
MKPGPGKLPGQEPNQAGATSAASANKEPNDATGAQTNIPTGADAQGNLI